MVKRERTAQPGLRPSTPSQAWAHLVAGNARFMAGASDHPHQTAQVRARVSARQRPFAALFGCADSRVPPEIVVDQGLGDVFVVRTAGHVVGPSVLGSLEYAVAQLTVPLVVVLAHTRCGAVAAAREAFSSGEVPGGFLRDIVERIAPSIVSAGAHGRVESAEVEHEHLRETCDLIADRSQLIRTTVDSGALAVAGAIYDFDSGRLRLAHVVGDVGAEIDALL